MHDCVEDLAGTDYKKRRERSNIRVKTSLKSIYNKLICKKYTQFVKGAKTSPTVCPKKRLIKRFILSTAMAKLIRKGKHTF